MTCSKCGYAMGAFDKSCPRCKSEVNPQGMSAPGHNYPSPVALPPSPYSNPQHSSAQPPVPAPIHQVPVVQPKSQNAAVGWVIAGVLGGALLVSVLRPQNQPSNVPNGITTLAGQQPAQQLQPVVRTGPSFFEVDSKMDDRLTQWTDAQKQSYWLTVTGTTITWTGVVTEVEMSSTGNVRLKCNPKTWGSDVSVTLDGSQIDRLPLINKKQQLTITGILSDHTLSGYTITQGRIVGL